MEILHHLATEYFHCWQLVVCPKMVHFYTMFSADRLYSLFEARRRELGLSQADLCALAFGKNDNTALQSLKKGASPSIERVEAFAKALQWELRLGPPEEKMATEVIVVGSDDYVAVPRLDVRLSAGPGAFNHDASEVERLAFRRDWLRRLGVAPKDAVLVGIKGDSMSPGLRDGDIALVDKARRQVRSGQVYALTDTDGSTRVKRIDIVPDHGYILRSDAPDFSAETRFGLDTKRMQIEGQVVWSGHVWER